MRIRDLGEMNLIERLARRVRLDSAVIKGAGDDAAVIRWMKDKYLLYTCDMLIEDVHFKLSEAAPEDIGWKALAVNISDIAAMGGIPRHAVISIGIDPGLPVAFIDRLYRGMTRLAKRFGVNLVGGDTNGSKKLVIDVSLIGEVERRNLALRSGAKPGDCIMVTGALGGSIKGRHLKFVPRVGESRWLVERFGISSMIDVSDGLILDLGRVLEASSCGARLYESCIPVSKDAASFNSAVREGEDFELLFTMSASDARRFFEYGAERLGTRVSLIGEVLDKRYGFKIIDSDGREKALKTEGYTHF